MIAGAGYIPAPVIIDNVKSSAWCESDPLYEHMLGYESEPSYQQSLCVNHIVACTGSAYESLSV